MRRRIIRLDGLGNEIKISKKERKKREKRYGKSARVKKMLLKEILDRKETQTIKAEIAGYLKEWSNGYHKKETPIDQDSLKSTMTLSRENENKRNVKKSPSFFWVTWGWLKKTLWWLN